MSFLKRRTSGIFIPMGSGFSELSGFPDSSIISVTKYLGYNDQQIFTYFNSSKTKTGIQVICFKIFTRDIVFIVTTPKTTYISPRELKQYLVNYSVSKIYDTSKITDILDDGISKENLTIEFLSETLKLKNTSSNGVFFSEKIKTYLYFTEGILTNYQFDDGLFPWAKDLRQHNRIIFDKIANAASRHHPDNPFLTNKEINIQAEAWANVPEAGRNEFISLHSIDGGINFQMLRVCHYKASINKQEFEELNLGRYQKLSQNELTTTYRLGLFEYTFSNEGDLIKTTTTAITLE